jgi:hypothetical protein
MKNSPGSLTSRRARIVLFAALALTLSPFAYAQFSSSLSGTVTDTSGAVISGAKVTLTDKASNAVKSFTTTGSGYYNFSELAPGDYSLETTAKGFQTNDVGDVTLAAESPRNVGIQLKIGAAAQTVTVNANEVSALNSSDASVGTSISGTDVKRLPVFGRDPYELLRLAPGTVSDAARSGSGSSVSLPNNQSGNQSNSGVFQTENQIQASAAGQRVTSNTYLIDGVSVDSLSHGGAAVVTPNPESVAEITAYSSNYDATEGRNVGLHTFVVTRAGSNQVHGSLFFQYDEPGLNAYPAYGGPAGALPVRDENKQREYAASLGFPILKNKLFFFASYEAVTDLDIGSSEQYVPTPQFFSGLGASRGGGIVNGVLNGPGGTPNVIKVLPISCANLQVQASGPPVCNEVAGGADIGSFAGALGTYLPAYDAAAPGTPNLVTGGGLDGVPDVEYTQVLSSSHYRGNQYNARVDYDLTPRDHFAVSGFIVKFDEGSPDASTGAEPLSDIPFKPFNATATVVYIHTFSPSLVNEARGNFTRFADNQINDAGTAVDFGIPRFEVQNYTFGRLYAGPAWGDTTPGLLAQNTYEVKDTLIQTIGSHTIHYGGSLRWEQDNDNNGGFSRPDYTFNGIWNWADDAPIDEAIAANPDTGGPANSQRNFRDRDIAAFVQHDWKVSSHLTVNTGLRWEYFEPIYNKGSEVNEPVFGPTAATYLTAAVLRPVNHLFNSNYNNWSPRFGFNWVPAGAQGKMAISGGFGVSYDRIDDQLFIPGTENGPGYGMFGLCCADATDTPQSVHIQFERGSSRSAFSYAPNPYLAVGTDPVTGLPNGAGEIEVYGTSDHTAQPMLESFSAQIEYQLPHQLVADIAYQGAVGHHFPRLVDQNFLYPTCAQIATDGSCTSGLTPFTAAYIPTDDVATNYNGVNLSLKKQFSHGYTFAATYTFSKSLDQGSYEGPGAESNQTDPANPKTEYGPSDFDLRHNFKVFGEWDLPGYRRGRGLVGEALTGWQVNGIFQFHTGFPWTPVTNVPTVAVVQSAATLAPTRPIAYYGGAHNSCSNGALISGSNFPGGGTKYFDISGPGAPGIGRNTFNSSCYLDTDMTAAREQTISIHGHETQLRFQANFYNAFNKLNLAPISSQSSESQVENTEFGQSPGSDSGRVIEFFGRLQF